MVLAFYKIYHDSTWIYILRFSWLSLHWNYELVYCLAMKSRLLRDPCDYYSQQSSYSCAMFSRALSLSLSLSVHNTGPVCPVLSVRVRGKLILSSVYQIRAISGMFVKICLGFVKRVSWWRIVTLYHVHCVSNASCIISLTIGR